MNERTCTQRIWRRVDHSRFVNAIIAIASAETVIIALLCDHAHAGLYCSGWVKTGPVGVILTTMSNAFETAEAIVEDYRQGTIIWWVRNFG
jgi:hypothetical protein